MAELHWRAYQETQVGGALAKMLAKRSGKAFTSTGPAGPANAILHELFAQRSGSWLMSTFFSYDVDKMVSEGAGWEAVLDKLKLI